MFQTGNNRGWENLKGVVMKSAEGSVGYLKGKVARKPMDNDSHNGEDAREKEVEEQEYRGRQTNISAPK